MAAAGWYPDPNSGPQATTGRFRYWDGTAWHDQTTDRPFSPAPASSPAGLADADGASPAPASPSQNNPAPPPPAPGAGRRRTGWPLAVGAGALGLAGLGFWLAQPDPGRVASVAAASASAAQATSTTAASSATSTRASAAGTSGQQVCLAYLPGAKPTFTKETFATAGLTMVRPGDGFHTRVATLPWLSTALATEKPVGTGEAAGGGQANVMVLGAAARQENPGTVEQVARHQQQCTVASSLYGPQARVTPVFSKAITLDGRPGWQLRSLVDTGTPLGPDTLDVLVVDTSDPTFWGVLLSGSVVRNTAEADDLARRLALLSAR